jgi:rSAM/selenodomain-associated transferase 1
MSETAAENGLAGFCAVAMMAKAPRIGQVKTRLAPSLSAREAALLGGCFIRDTAGNILAAAESVPMHGHVAFSPPGSEAVFRALLPPAFRLLPSRRAGLGFSLADAARDLLAAGYGSVCLVNSDSPTLPTAMLIEAVEALRAPGDRVVLGPAEDGGYYCIGLKEPHRRLFEDIEWSTERVFAQTIERASEIGLGASVLAPWYDVDDPASLRRLARELLGHEAPKPGAKPYAAPHTAALLRRLVGDGGGDGSWLGTDPRPAATGGAAP